MYSLLPTFIPLSPSRGAGTWYFLVPIKVSLLSCFNLISVLDISGGWGGEMGTPHTYPWGPTPAGLGLVWNRGAALLALP